MARNSFISGILSSVNPALGGVKLLFIIMLFLIPLEVYPQSAEVDIQIDGAEKYQTIDGFGVNINTAWWYNGEYSDAKVIQPAIDLLVDSLGATIFRAVIEDIDWEAVNDDNDPNHFNWTYFNSVFTNKRFQGVWNTLRYLNKKGIRDGLIISFMGAPPASPPLEKPDPKRSWMGGTDHVIYKEMEDELVESISALLYYMRHTARVQFALVSPMNETDILAATKSRKPPDGIVEGPNMPDAVQYARVTAKLAEKLNSLGMGDVRFVAPDAAGDRLFGECLNEMVKDTLLMSRMAYWGVHQYGNDAQNYLNIVDRLANPNKSYWVTETAGISNMLGQLDDGAGAYIFWDGFDCVYQHGRRNGYGDIPPNDYVYWLEGEEGKPLLKYVSEDNSWVPRKQFFEHAHLMKFIRPGSVRLGLIGQDSGLVVHAFQNPDGNIVIAGRNNTSQTKYFSGNLKNLSKQKNIRLIYTDSLVNFSDGTEVMISGESFKAYIPSHSVFTLTGTAESLSASGNDDNPEPDGWYAGDIHVHRNCGEVTPLFSEAELINMMEPNDLAVVTLLADMGNGEVKDNKTDLPKVNGADDKQSKEGRILHWDAEWHFDPAGVTFENKALGGHLLLLGLKEAHTIWDESAFKILEWGKKQNAITGFCHMQYLTDSFQNDLSCCIPVDFPVETALGTIDFLSEDVLLNDASVNAYYKILNCGFRPGWAAGTDFPCNNSRPLGSLLTYVRIQDQPLTYRKWIEGIKEGRTVITTNGHIEFLDLKVNGSFSPGDELMFSKKGNVKINVTWTSKMDQTGYIEILCNGRVVAKHDGNSKPGAPVIFSTDLSIYQSSWICARRMDDRGHQSHTAPVFVTVGKKPVRASAADAEYFINWIDNILLNIELNGPWSQYFSKDVNAVRDRYMKARNIYKEIALEAGKINKN